jgi:cytochrome c nitrite reductase small subunit
MDAKNRKVSAKVRTRLLKPAMVLAVLLGMFFGLGFYTFGYSKGLSYLSSDPAACANCHIMQDEYSSWQKGTHHTVAVCVECHLPHDFVPKMIAKSEHGWRHSKAFTLQNFHEPIQITPKSAAQLQTNCLRCHGEFLHAIVGGSTTDQDAMSCVHCHQGVGHGARQ